MNSCSNNLPRHRTQRLSTAPRCYTYLIPGKNTLRRVRVPPIINACVLAIVCKMKTTNKYVCFRVCVVSSSAIDQFLNALNCPCTHRDKTFMGHCFFLPLKTQWHLCCDDAVKSRTSLDNSTICVIPWCTQSHPHILLYGEGAFHPFTCSLHDPAQHKRFPQ